MRPWATSASRARSISSSFARTTGMSSSRVGTKGSGQGRWRLGFASVAPRGPRVGRARPLLVQGRSDGFQDGRLESRHGRQYGELRREVHQRRLRRSEAPPPATNESIRPVVSGRPRVCASGCSSWCRQRVAGSPDRPSTRTVSGSCASSSAPVGSGHDSENTAWLPTHLEPRNGLTDHSLRRRVPCASSQGH